MSTDTFNRTHLETDITHPPTEIAIAFSNLKNGIWMVGIPSWMFGITDRSFASFADGYLSAIELVHLFTASFFFISWLYLKPEIEFENETVTALERYEQEGNPYLCESYLKVANKRMVELRKQHMISQEYILPVPYLCQIYHLLNLKHLETVHSFSLSNLRILKVSSSQPTQVGGRIKFQTVLESPINALRIWRQPIVEVDLILHTPYTVELSIPVYNDKRITVIFNALPLNEKEHKLFIDIYSNLEWPKPLLQILLHISACLTLFEDLPYLHKLAERNIHRLANMGRVSNHETMWLFKRFVDLYGSGIKPATPPAGLLKAQEA